MTLGEILTVIRDQIMDSRTGAPYRHSDAKLLRYVNLGLAEARRIRPDLFLPSVFVTTYVYTTDDLAQPFPLTYGYEMALIEYVSGYVSIEEDEYVAEGRAAALLQRYSNKLLGVQM